MIPPPDRPKRFHAAPTCGERTVRIAMCRIRAGRDLSHPACCLSARHHVPLAWVTGGSRPPRCGHQLLGDQAHADRAALRGPLEQRERGGVGELGSVPSRSLGPGRPRVARRRRSRGRRSRLRRPAPWRSGARTGRSERPCRRGPEPVRVQVEHATRLGDLEEHDGHLCAGRHRERPCGLARRASAGRGLGAGTITSAIAPAASPGLVSSPAAAPRAPT